MGLKEYNARIDADNAAKGITPEEYEHTINRLKSGAMIADEICTEDELERYAAQRERMLVALNEEIAKGNN